MPRPAKKKATPRSAAKKAHYSSVYFDLDSMAKLNRMADETNKSHSQVICGLIQQADATNQARITELVAEMASLMRLR